MVLGLASRDPHMLKAESNDFSCKRLLLEYSKLNSPGYSLQSVWKGASMIHNIDCVMCLRLLCCTVLPCLLYLSRHYRYILAMLLYNVQRLAICNDSCLTMYISGPTYVLMSTAQFGLRPLLPALHLHQHLHEALQIKLASRVQDSKQFHASIERPVVGMMSSTFHSINGKCRWRVARAAVQWSRL